MNIALILVFGVLLNIAIIVTVANNGDGDAWEVVCEAISGIEIIGVGTWFLEAAINSSVRSMEFLPNLCFIIPSYVMFFLWMLAVLDFDAVKNYIYNRRGKKEDNKKIKELQDELKKVRNDFEAFKTHVEYEQLKKEENDNR